MRLCLHLAGYVSTSNQLSLHPLYAVVDGGDELDPLHKTSAGLENPFERYLIRKLRILLSVRRKTTHTQSNPRHEITNTTDQAGAMTPLNSLPPGSTYSATLPLCHP